MCFYDSSCNLIGMASSLAISVGKKLSAEDAATLAAFFTAFADNLAIIATTKSKNETP